MFFSSFAYILLAVVIKVRRLFVFVHTKESIQLQATNTKHSLKFHMPLEYTRPASKPCGAPNVVFISLKP